MTTMSPAVDIYVGGIQITYKYIMYNNYSCGGTMYVLCGKHQGAFNIQGLSINFFFSRKKITQLVASNVIMFITPISQYHGGGIN